MCWWKLKNDPGLCVPEGSKSAIEKIKKENWFLVDPVIEVHMLYWVKRYLVFSSATSIDDGRQYYYYEEKQF